MSDWTQLCQSNHWSSITNLHPNKTDFRQNNVIKIKQQKHTLWLPAQNIKFIVVGFSNWNGIVVPLPASRINGEAAISLMYSSVSSTQSLLTEALAQQSPKVKHPSLTWTTRIYHHQKVEFFVDVSTVTKTVRLNSPSVSIWLICLLS